MRKSNKEIVLEFIDVVENQKVLNDFTEYMSEDYVGHSAPYIGLGFNIDTTSSDSIKINSIAEGGPSDGYLQIGDELLAAEDDTRKWETIDDLKTAVWGQGKIGTSVKLAIRRDGEEMEIELARKKVGGFDFPFSEIIDNWKHFLTVECPDRKEDVVHAVEEGDLVMIYSIVTGTLKEFDHHAIWSICSVFRLRDGKITEGWGVGPDISYYTQLGFKIERPST